MSLNEAVRIIPAYLDLQPNELLVVCTQSCSVCSANFAKEPLVEVLVATPLPKYNLKGGEAKGKNNSVLHLPIEGLSGVQALSCDLGRRAFVPRQKLRAWQPGSAAVRQVDRDAFQGWLAHYYSRIALPGELVRRLRGPDGIATIIRDTFEGKVGDVKIADNINSIRIRISTEEELLQDNLYDIWLIIVCDDQATVEYLDRHFAMNSNFHSKDKTIAGVLLKKLIVDTSDNLTLAQTSGYTRLTEWEDLSALPERLLTIRATT